MWFKQVRIFQLKTPILYDADKLSEQLEPLAFTPCLPSFPSSVGWIPLLEEEAREEEEGAALVQGINGYLMICLQFEDKILPAAVIRQELDAKVKEIQARYDRKVSSKEKYAIKDEIVQTLLPRAFSKLSRVYGYIDTKNNWLVLDTTSTPKIEKFIEMLKKSLGTADITPVTAKLATTLTGWLTSSAYPDIFAIEKACVLTDPNKESRVIRCQQQDLLADAIKLMIKDGCEVKQIALSWNDCIQFTLVNDFSLQSIKYQDEVIEQAKESEPETKRQQFDADFLIMTETLTGLLKDLLGALALSV